MSPPPHWATEPSRRAAAARHLAVAAAVNAKAVAKIVKKHDKVTRSHAGAAYLHSRGGGGELPWAMPALLAALEQAGRTAELLLLAGTRGCDPPARGGGRRWAWGHRLSLAVRARGRPGAATSSAMTVASTGAAPSVAPTSDSTVDAASMATTVAAVVTAAMAGDATGSPPPLATDDGSGVAHDATCAVCLELLVSPRRLQCGHIFCAACNASQLAAGDDRCALCRTPRAARTGVPAPELRAALTAAYPVAYACRRRAVRREAAAAAARDNAYAARVAGLGGRGVRGRGGGWEGWVGLSA